MNARPQKDTMTDYDNEPLYTMTPVGTRADNPKQGDGDSDIEWEKAFHKGRKKHRVMNVAPTPQTTPSLFLTAIPAPIFTSTGNNLQDALNSLMQSTYTARELSISKTSR